MFSKKNMLNLLFIIVVTVTVTHITLKFEGGNEEVQKEEKMLIGQSYPTAVPNYLRSDSSDTNRHYTLGVEMNADGTHSSSKEGHKVAIYGAAGTGTTGNPDIWAANFLAQVDESLPFKNNNGVNAQGIELDVNNNQGDYYQDWDWDRGNVVGLNVTSGGSFPISAGIRIGSTSQKNIPSYGMIIDNGSIKSGLMFLGKHKIGIDTSNSEIKDALLIGQNQMISAKDSDGNTQKIIKINGRTTEITIPSEGISYKDNNDLELASIDSNGNMEIKGIKYAVNYSEPSNPEQGLVVYADGVKWNPGEGEGLYLFKSEGWTLLR